MVAALRAAGTKLDARAGKKKGGWGEGIFARPRFSAAAEFRISLCEMRRQENCLPSSNVFAIIILNKLIYTHYK